MIILLLFLCTQLYAVDVDLVPPAMTLNPYAQALQERENALHELHPEPRTWYDPYCPTSCNRDAARRLFPYEQDDVNTRCQTCYIAMRRSGCALEDFTCCSSSLGCTIECTTATVAAANNVWCMSASALLAVMTIGIATPFVLKYFKGVTKECDTTLSLWRLQHHQFTPTMPVLEELDEPEEPMQPYVAG